MSAPRLSVVVARTPGAQRGGAAWLEALARSCRGVATEIVEVDAPSGDATHAGPDDAPGDARVVRVAAPADALVPVRWGLGLRAARGDVVAFTTDRCVVHPAWAQAALAAIAAGASAVGGPIALAATRATDRAVHRLRFGALPAAAADARLAVADVAADNAAYDRARLLALDLPLDGGFWEVEANRRLRLAGASLEFRGDMRADYVGGERLLPLVAQRFAHGRHAGAWRVATGARRGWQIALAAPLVPLVLLARARRRGPLGAATPAFLALAAAWAAGEALGARGAHGSARARATTSAAHDAGARDVART